MGLINWKDLDKKTKKVVRLWAFLGLSGAGLISWGAVEVYGLIKFKFEAYVKELADESVKAAKKENSLSYKLAEELDVNRDQVAHEVAEMLTDHTSLMDSVAKFNRQLKPWGLQQMRTINVGPKKLPNGREVYTDFDGIEYPIISELGTDRKYWVDSRGRTRWARPEYR